VAYFIPKLMFCSHVGEGFSENFCSGFQFTNLQEGFASNTFIEAICFICHCNWGFLEVECSVALLSTSSQCLRNVGVLSRLSRTGMV
jgi:hypothetical protein